MPILAKMSTGGVAAWSVLLAFHISHLARIANEGGRLCMTILISNAIISFFSAVAAAALSRADY